MIDTGPNWPLRMIRKANLNGTASGYLPEFILNVEIKGGKRAQEHCSKTWEALPVRILRGDRGIKDLTLIGSHLSSPLWNSY